MQDLEKSIKTFQNTRKRSLDEIDKEAETGRQTRYDADFPANSHQV